MAAAYGTSLLEVNRRKSSTARCTSCLVGPCAWIGVALTQGAAKAVLLSVTFRILFLKAVQSESSS